MDDLLRIDNLRVSFRLDKNTTVEAVKGVSFAVQPGETLAIVGESGSGKSVSVLAAMGLLPLESASIAPGSSIRWQGRELLGLPVQELRALRGSEMSMIFQEPMSSLNPLFTVGDQIAEVLVTHRRASWRAARQRAVELLAEVGIPDPAQRASAYPFQLSGGQQQRVMIAMAIACEPKLLIADEPTTALDVTIQQQIIDLVNDLRRKRNMSVLWISHDLAVVGEIADRVIVMRHGEVRESASVRDIFTTPRDAYTQALLQCHAPLDRRPRRLPVIDDFLSGKGPAAADQAERAPKVGAGGTAIIEVRGLSKHYQLRAGLFARRALKAVDDVSFTLERGRTLGLVGESGSGKSTLGLTLLRLIAASGGEVKYCEGGTSRDLLRLSPAAQMAYKRKIQIIFQNPYASLNPRFVVRDILLEPMRIHGIGADDAAREREALALLERVGLPALSMRKYPHEFSGGQRQRIAIARALSLRPEVLVCDEAVSALDVSVQAQVLNLLQDLQDEFGLAYLFISHDLAVVKYIADRVLVMQHGRIVEAADAETLYRDPQHPYTRQLLAAIPRGYARGHRH